MSKLDSRKRLPQKRSLFHNNLRTNVFKIIRNNDSSHQMQQLPQISSQYLKNAANDMLFLKKLHHRVFKLDLPQFIEDKSKRNNKTQSLKEEQVASGVIDTTKELAWQINQFTNEHILPKKIAKSFSQAKKSQILPQNPADPGNLIIRLRNPKSSKYNKYSRANTESSDQKSILLKLQQLKQKQAFRSISPPRTISLNQNPSKDLKSGFVLRQKLSREMYGEEREQLRLVHKLMEERGLASEIRVRNYTKFLPFIGSLD